MSRLSPRRQKRSFRPAFDAMEKIELLSTTSAAIVKTDLVMNSATDTGTSSVTANYKIVGAALTQPLTFNVYRSATPNYSPSNLLATDTLSASDKADLSVGLHSVKLSLNGKSLPPDPGHEYVTIVANPGKTVPEASYTNDTAYFQIFVVGAISHGLVLAGTDPSGAVPSWVTQMASSLVSVEKYNYVLPFNWVTASGTELPGEAVAAGKTMAAQVAAKAAYFQSLHPGDVVDFQFIGHSRGAVVISQAIQDIVKSYPSAFNGSYIKMTLLDPHPALEYSTHQDYFSYNVNSPSARTGALVTHDFQRIADDPPVVIPSVVNSADVFYQQTPFSEFPSSNVESELNYWGHGNDGTISNLSSTTPAYHNLTSVVYPGIGRIGHLEVPDYYIDAVINAGLSLTYN